MKLDESSLPLPLYAASAEGSQPEADLPSGSDSDRSQDDSLEIPFPCPADTGRLERGQAVEIFGDERGGQTPKRPSHRKGEQER